MTKTINNIAAKGIVGNVRSLLGSAVSVELFRVYGTAQKAVHGETRFGVQTTIVGEFEAVNAATGEVFRSTKLNLPEEVMQALVFELKGQNGRSITGVKFGYDIGAVAAENDVGYKYTCASLIEFAPRDPFAEFKKLFANAEKLTELDSKVAETPAATGKGSKKQPEAATA